MQDSIFFFGGKPKSNLLIPPQEQNEVLQFS